MARDLPPLAQRRQELQPQYGWLYDALIRILFEADPIGINYGHNTSEYESEVTTILPQLQEAHSPTDVYQIVFDELDQWFGGAMSSVYKRNPKQAQARLGALTETVWNEWQRWLQENQSPQ